MIDQRLTQMERKYEGLSKKYPAVERKGGTSYNKQVSVSIFLVLDDC
jgi:hypothetical protein